jgi:hypothetical protein
MIKVRITGLVIHKGEEVPVGDELRLPDHQASYLITHKQAERAEPVQKPKRKSRRADSDD